MQQIIKEVLGDYLNITTHTSQQILKLQSSKWLNLCLVHDIPKYITFCFIMAGSHSRLQTAMPPPWSFFSFFLPGYVFFSFTFMVGIGTWTSTFAVIKPTLRGWHDCVQAGSLHWTSVSTVGCLAVTLVVLCQK